VFLLYVEMIVVYVAILFATQLVVVAVFETFITPVAIATLAIIRVLFTL
jgi:hypothetical protein